MITDGIATIIPQLDLFIQPGRIYPSSLFPVDSCAMNVRGSPLMVHKVSNDWVAPGKARLGIIVFPFQGFLTR